VSSVTLSMDTDRGDHRPRLVTFAGATARTLTITLSGENLSGDTVTLTARNGGADGTLVMDNVALTVSDAAGGVCTYVDSDEYLDGPAELDAQVRIEDSGGAFDFSEPFRLVVLGTIAVKTTDDPVDPDLPNISG